MLTKIKKCFLFSLLSISFGSAMAKALDCPSAQEFQSHLLIPPYSSFPQKNQITFASVSLNEKKVDESGSWYLVLKDIKASPEDNHEGIVSDLIHELENVNSNAYQLSSSYPELGVSYCMYRSSTHPKLSAMAYFVPFSDEDSDMKIQGQKGNHKKSVHKLVKLLALA
jgi:hypothetical protein